MGNREIKFRQPLFNTNGTFKEWHYWGNLADGFVSPITRKYIVDVKIADSIDSLQYTGLKDVNDKEIYEGDILEFDNGDKVILKTEDAWLEFYCEAIGDVDCEDQWRDLYRIERAEIIGNIHENKNLLE